MKFINQYSLRLYLILIILISLFLRWMLVAQGGQFFNADEYRYLVSRIIARELQKGNYRAAVTEATRKADHLGFKIIGILPALAEVKHDRDINNKDAHGPGIFFSLFSCANLLIVWFLALRLGATEHEALWAVFLMATSNVLFYYSSHLFPYDVSMTFGLLALYFAISNHFRTGTSILIGILSFLCFVTYGGYWTLAAFALLTHVFFSARFDSRFFLRVIFASLAFFAPIVGLLWLSKLYGNDLLSDYLAISQMIVNGDPSEGAILPFKYFWAAEHGVFLIWLFLTLLAMLFLRRQHPQRILIWLGGLLFVYGCLVVSSVILQKFVVYGRLARQLVPFIALTGAYSLQTLEARVRYGRLAVGLILGAVAIQSALNFRQPFLLTYPLEFAKQVQERYPDFRPPKNMTYFYSPNVAEVGPYRAYFVKFVFPLPKEEVPIQGEILMSAENPLSSFPPFLYDEGFPPEERDAFPTLMMTITRVQ